MNKYLLIFFVLFTLNVAAQDDEKIDDDQTNWKYIFIDIGYGSRGPGGALGFRYWNIGASVGATGFASDIPKTANIYPGDNINIGDLPTKKYPSNIVFGDFIAFYDINLDYTIFAGIGFYSAIDTILAYREVQGITTYYKKAAETSSGITYNLGIQTSLYFLNEDNYLLDQIVAGLGYHSKLGLFLRISYRWE